MKRLVPIAVSLVLLACSRAPQDPAPSPSEPPAPAAAPSPDTTAPAEAPAGAPTATPDATPADAPPLEVAVHERAGRRFAAVDLLRTDGADALPFDVYLAPMLVQERRADGSPGAPAPGQLVLGEDGHATVVVGHPTVYYTRSTAHLGGEERQQLAFVWWYPDDGDGLRAQGVRITLGRSGVPIVWEVLADPDGARPVYVSETLEERAAQQLGAPLPGRYFTTERGLDDTPQVIVARAIENGAVPMGPFVYVEAGTHAVRTLLCRCSPAEYDTIAGETLFRLIDFASLGQIGLIKRQWSAALPHLIGEDPPPTPPDASGNWLEHVLRLPDGL